MSLIVYGFAVTLTFFGTLGRLSFAEFVIVNIALLIAHLGGRIK